MPRPQPLEDRSTWSAIGYCPVEHAMTVIGSRPAMLIMREAFYGTTRFDDFVERVGMTPTTAASRLKALTELGMLARRPYQEDGARVRDEYVLTKAGEDLMPVLVGLMQWSMDHLGASRAMDLVHKDCGHKLVATVQCPEHPDERMSSHTLDAKWSRRTQR